MIGLFGDESNQKLVRVMTISYAVMEKVLALDANSQFA